MPSNQPIKIVKRKQRELITGEHEPPESKTERQTRRDVFETITSWIAEQRETRQEILRREALLLRQF